MNYYEKRAPDFFRLRASLNLNTSLLWRLLRVRIRVRMYINSCHPFIGLSESINDWLIDRRDFSVVRVNGIN